MGWFAAGRFLVCTSFLLLHAASASQVRGPGQAETRRMCMITGGEAHEFEKAPRVLADAIASRLRNSVRLEVTITQNLELFRAENLQKCELLVSSVCRQAPLSREEEEGLLTSKSS